MLEHITASEIAGYGVGALLFCATISAPKVDSFFSSSQRSSSLGMCKKCGDLKLIACSTCKGSGSIKEGGSLIFSPVDDLSFRGKSKIKFLSCKKCQARGHFRCSKCSKLPEA